MCCAGQRPDSAHWAEQLLSITAHYPGHEWPCFLWLCRLMTDLFNNTQRMREFVTLVAAAGGVNLVLFIHCRVRGQSAEITEPVSSHCSLTRGGWETWIRVNIHTGRCTCWVILTCNNIPFKDRGKSGPSKNILTYFKKSIPSNT